MENYFSSNWLWLCLKQAYISVRKHLKKVCFVENWPRYLFAGEGFVFVLEKYSFFSRTASNLSVIQLCLLCFFFYSETSEGSIYRCSQKRQHTAEILKNKHSIFLLVRVTISHGKNFDRGRFWSHARSPFSELWTCAIQSRKQHYNLFVIFVKIHLNTFHVPNIYFFQNLYQKIQLVDKWGGTVTCQRGNCTCSRWADRVFCEVFYFKWGTLVKL